MSARDQSLFLETYLGLKRALKRKSYDSDSDSPIDQSTNRGNKLKRRSRFVREGQLGAADGSSMFTEVVEHAGYRREIISRNAPLVDEEGYEIDSDEDDGIIQEAVAAAADENPYSGIHLEQLLAPLTSVTELPSHPTLSRPFSSKALTELANQGCGWMHKENNALWQVKPLLAKFCGDHNWIDCSLMLTPDDGDLFDDDRMAHLAASRSKGRGTEAATINDTAENGRLLKGRTEGGKDKVNGTRLAGRPDAKADASTELSNDPSTDPDADYIHPLFLAPRAAHPEANVGLPEAEAEDVRRLLQLWVQKQEEVARGSRTLHEGLLRADRLRKTVYLWSKAEGHPDLSDGEDYYDREAWGLSEELKKGHDEEEEDTTQTHKKTRNRK